MVPRWLSEFPSRTELWVFTVAPCLLTYLSWHPSCPGPISHSPTLLDYLLHDFHLNPYLRICFQENVNTLRQCSGASLIQGWRQGPGREEEGEKLVDKYPSFPSNRCIILGGLFYASQEVLVMATLKVHRMLVFPPSVRSPPSSRLLAGIHLK